MSEYRIEESARKRALKFKEDYERHFEKNSKRMRKIAKETEAYLAREHLQDDTDATLNIISILPSCHYRIYLYGRYHELVKKAGRTDTELEYRKWKIGGETSEKIQKFAVIYRKREKCLRKMESDAEAECIGYLKKSGLWDDLEAVHEMRCCLPICLLRHKLDERYYELFMKENEDFTDED